MSVIIKRAADLRGFRIFPKDSSHFIRLLDPIADGAAFTLVVEVFAPGSATPPNTHRAAQEAFFVLRGQGRGTPSCFHPALSMSRRTPGRDSSIA